MDYLDYREKLGLSFNDKEKVGFFLARAHNFLRDEYDFGNLVSPKTYCSFFDSIGERRDAPIGFCDANVILQLLIKNTNDLNHFLFYYTVWINCLDNEIDSKFSRERYIDSFKSWSKESKLNFTFLQGEGGKLFIFPEGAKELDDKLVSEPLEWLKAYPTTHKQFCLTLKQYDDSESIRDVADNLRKTLEGFLQEFFNNTKILANNKSEVGNYLKSKNVDSELISLFTSLLSNFDQANNSVAKHHDNIHRNMLEFILYQTGTFIRTLIKLKEDI